ncbi:MAG: lamin tail domain-containing protein [Candidatus Promineifilaceae bacterium]|nr:lamin tail domain-containing protein [Candidatus Promineifilaceae bacterium]
MSFRRMLPFILINILVSATVVLAILWWWESRQEELPTPLVEAPEETVIAPTEAPSQENGPAAQSQAVETLQAEESSGPQTHIVGAGETLGQISVRYDISMEELMSANGMSNPNFLFVGQELIIPNSDAVEEAEEGVDEEIEEGGSAILPTPIPTEPPTEGEAMITIAEVIGPGEAPIEAVQIVNNGSSSAALGDWKLADQFGNFYTFGPITLFGDGAGILVHTSSGQDSATDLFWGSEDSLWESGDMVILYDAAGAVQAEYQVP